MLITVIKILLIIGITALLVYPFITGNEKNRKRFMAGRLKYVHPHNKKNAWFIGLAVAEFIIVALIFDTLNTLLNTLNNLPFINNLFASIVHYLSTQYQLNFILFTLRLVVINLIFLYGFFIIKAFLKKVVLDPAYKLNKNKSQKNEQKDKNNENNPKDDKLTTEENDEDEKKRKKRRIPDFLHSDEENDKENDIDKDKIQNENLNEEEEKKYYGPVAAFILGLFFEGEDFKYAKDWVVRVKTVLRCFIVLVEITYALFLLTVLISMFFPLPAGMYNFLVNTLKIGDWYIYPVISLLFLHEICNFLDTPYGDPRKAEEKKKKKKEQQEEEALDERLRKLLNTLKKHFDAEHYLRYYPESPQDEISEYSPQSKTYKSALEYISKRMKLTSGRVVQSYMQCLDASFNDDHVYFASSFYSELGEYLIAYTYIRLLSGSRMVYIVSDPDERVTLRSFIGERLMQLTGTIKGGAGWRIYTADERLDQADILIACPEDFSDGDLTSQYSDFFEEVSNAIFLDADRMISLDSYLCPVMATSMQKATNGDIRFIFLTQDIYKGFAARSIPKFFCAEPVLSFSSAKENESVSYILWNRESKSHRIYNKHGQKTTCLECIIADLARKHKIDGIRLITDSSLDHAERKLLSNCGVEINKLYRDAVDVNYMIYSDERCNLAASIYACTRFRGKKRSIVHIISKPYLLREYFISKAATENFVNRSSFIQPRVLEHVDQHKLMLLRVFCNVSTEKGMPLSEFENRMQEAINVCMESGYIISSAYCKKLLEGRRAEELKTGELAAYLIAGLCDSDIYHNDEEAAACAHRSLGNSAKEFYLIIDPAKYDGFTLHREKYIIFNRAKDIYNMLFECNKRIELRLHNEVIGYLDTFPIRAHLEFIAGQSIVFRNSEYEIEHISEDGTTIYLRNENVKIRHCLNTVHLRRYQIDSLTPIAKHLGVLNNTKLNLEEIRVTECFAKFTAETYGFYGLTSDKQTLDFYHKDGVDGNSHVSSPHVRNIADGRILKVELQSRIECNDRMRLLLAAVFNEFVRTIFPKAYHFISIVPILKEPFSFDRENEPQNETDRIKALYPYLVHPSGEFIENDDHRITFLFVNDCFEDVGAFQWFYDLSGRYMQEFLANIYSYLHWLRLRPDKEHYIYFGGKSLPECYDLDGCCTLLDGYNLVLSDLGEDDIETAGDDLQYDKIERCSFCHKEMESGRFSFFDKARFICADCHDTVESQERLDELYLEMKKYLEESYPEINIGSAQTALDPVYSLTAEQVLSEYYYRLDISERTIFAERDEPADNIRVSLLRGLIELWQSDNSYFMEYSKAQLYYEELIFLHSRGLHVSANWIYNALDSTLRGQIDEIVAYTGAKVVYGEPEIKDSQDCISAVSENSDNSSESQDGVTDNQTEGNDTATENSEKKTSFDFIRMKCAYFGSGDDDEDDTETFEEDDFTGLYDPNKIPRFWKRYLRNQKLDTGSTEDIPEIEEDTENDTEDNKKKSKKSKGLFGRKTSPGEKICPYEDDEAINPRIKVYNNIVRHAYNYDEQPVCREGLSIDEIQRILNYALGDYPELFWLTRWIPSYSDTHFNLHFRCKDANDKLDVKQIDRKRAELKKAAKKFTRGITKKTDPYEALTTLYRRIVLETDYDSLNLNTNISNDEHKDDQLRSLYSALVEHKVVCAGYAVAMQYLLQSVGIVSGYVISELDSENICHAFNILKLGKYCYYLDSTWGDWSDTKTGNKNKDLVLYNYFCVPYNEFVLASPSMVPMHIPRASYYPTLEQFRHTNHEYYRYRKAYLPSYNEAEIIRIFAETAMAYDEKEMGEFTVGIRFASQAAGTLAHDKLLAQGTIYRLIRKAKEEVTKKQKAKLLDRKCLIYPVSETGVLLIRFTDN